MSPLPERGEPPWYAATGLKFLCTACGQCCTGAPGHVWVDSKDIRRMAKHRGMTPEAFARLYVRPLGDRLSLKERDNGDCVMLEDRKCSVYEVKPTPCSTFPFWEDVVETKAQWDATAEKCPGMNRGDVYSEGEIEALTSGISAPLMEKQAAAARGEPASEPVVEEAAWAKAFADLEALYADLDAELPRYKFVCQASGDCCDFEAFGHRLFVTTIEAEYFFRNSPQQRQNENPSLCPAWGSDRMCKARQGRMLGCRTFYCGTYKNGDPSEVYEKYYARVKAIHDRHGIPFRYRDVVEWSADRRPSAR